MLSVALIPMALMPMALIPVALIPMALIPVALIPMALIPVALIPVVIPVALMPAVLSSLLLSAAVPLGAQLSGTGINMVTVAVGSAVGLSLRQRLPAQMQRTVMQGVGLLTVILGVQMALPMGQVQGGAVDGTILALVAIATGGILGEWWEIERRLQQVGAAIKRGLRRGRNSARRPAAPPDPQFADSQFADSQFADSQFAEGFAAASLLFCIGPMTILGSLTNGLTGDARLLLLKSAMDGVASIALAGSLGAGVAASVITIAIVQGGIALSAGILGQFLPDPATDPHVILMSAVGGLTILGIGLNLLELGQVRVASFLPALAIAPLVYALAAAVTG